MTAFLWLLWLRVSSWATAVQAFVCTRWWPGWVIAGLLLVPLSCSRSALGTAREQLLACQAAAAAPKPASVEKGNASSSIKVTVRHGVFDAPSIGGSSAPLATGSSWPASPCPDVVVEAGSQAAFSREETPPAPTAPVVAAAPQSELWTDLGYNLGPVAGPGAALRFEHGRGAAWASAGFMGGQPTWGVGAGYCLWRQ